jgi:hypothetical protein
MLVSSLQAAAHMLNGPSFAMPTNSGTDKGVRINLQGLQSMGFRSGAG